MTVILVRHAKAMDRKLAFLRGIKDEDRPLTDVGRIKFTKQALAYNYVFSDAKAFLTSGLLRADQSLEILQTAVSLKTKVLVMEELRPEADPKAFAEYIALKTNLKSVAVSHEPFITNFLNYIKPKMEIPKIKKGCMIILNITYKKIQIVEILQPK